MRRARICTRAALLLTLAALLPTGGCATMTGLVTGAFTGAVDAPAQVYRHNRGEMTRHPEYWIYDVLILGPIGFAAGPLAGLAKGFGLDMQWLLGQVEYKDVFGGYGRESIWRPYTIHW